MLTIVYSNEAHTLVRNVNKLSQRTRNEDKNPAPGMEPFLEENMADDSKITLGVTDVCFPKNKSLLVRIEDAHWLFL